MKILLVPVDGSENSLNAANYAADMALAIEADIHLLHVVPIPFSPAAAPVGYVFNDMENAGASLLRKLTEDLRQRTHSQVTVISVEKTGSVEYELAAISKLLKPYAVIMGAPEGKFARALSGSPAVDAARHLPYPVLIIPKDAAFRRIRRIVLACEVDDIAESMPVTLGFLNELKKLFDAKFDLLHVYHGSQYKEQLQVFGLYRWQRYLDKLEPELHTLASKNIPETISEYLSEHDADWLMIFPEQHGLLSFHRSMSKPLIMHCPVPVLSISEKASANLPASEIREKANH